MLQIVTKMYFREDVELYSTLHREVLFTNCTFLREEAVPLPIGKLAPSTGVGGISTATLEVIEHLEAKLPDGTRSLHIATGGSDLIDDIADVLSIGLNAIFSRNSDLVRRLVPSIVGQVEPSRDASLFRRTFEPHRYVNEEERDELRQFMSRLVALNRQHFERAMRAVRRIARATQRATEDRTTAYVDLISAIETLSVGAEIPTPAWERLDDRKRKLFDEALKDVEPHVTERVRQAVIEAERLGAKSRFVSFALEGVSPEFFRGEAEGAKWPIRGADFERALKRSYDIRSSSVHSLEELRDEVWMLGGGADSVTAEGELILTLEGLARLARHLLKRYAASAPTELDTEFDWRKSLPGQLQMSLAPQYWIWQAGGFSHSSAARYFNGFVENLLDVFAKREDGVTNMRAVLERIEQMLPGTADGENKTLMVGIYALWHRTLREEEQLEGADELLAKHEHLLEEPEMVPFVVGLLTNRTHDWSADQWRELALKRREQRKLSAHLELPPSMDMALQVIAAEKLRDAGRTEEAAELAGYAIEEIPGEPRLLAWESGLVKGEEADLDLRALTLGLPPEPGEAGGGNAGEAVEPESAP